MKKSTRETIAVGRAIATELGVSLSAVVPVAEIEAAVAEVASLGVGRVHAAAGAGLDRYSVVRFAALVEKAFRESGADVVLLPATSRGKDLGPASAARIDGGIVSGVTKLEVVGGGLSAIRPVYAGNIFVTSAPASLPTVVTVRPNTREPPPQWTPRPRAFPSPPTCRTTRSGPS